MADTNRDQGGSASGTPGTTGAGLMGGGTTGHVGTAGHGAAGTTHGTTGGTDENEDQDEAARGGAPTQCSSRTNEAEKTES